MPQLSLLPVLIVLGVPVCYSIHVEFYKNNNDSGCKLISLKNHLLLNEQITNKIIYFN